MYPHPHTACVAAVAHLSFASSHVTSCQVFGSHVTSCQVFDALGSLRRACAHACGIIFSMGGLRESPMPFFCAWAQGSRSDFVRARCLGRHNSAGRHQVAFACVSILYGTTFRSKRSERIGSRMAEISISEEFVCGGIPFGSGHACIRLSIFVSVLTPC